MNPSLEYAQMVPGHNGGKGRQYGILDTYSFVEMLDAVCLLEGSAAFRSDDSEALKKWFSELLEWICTSEQGMAEAATANNHGTAYDAQVIARRIIEEFPEKAEYLSVFNRYGRVEPSDRFFLLF